VILCAALWGWHLQDRAAAIEAAREGFVREAQLTAEKAKVAHLKRQLAAGREAAQVLQERLQAAKGEAQRFAAELEAFERETEINPEGVVDGDLLRLLRAR
jgi:ribosomal protein S8